MADPITPGVPRRFAPVTEIQRPAAVPRTEPPSKPPKSRNEKAAAEQDGIVVQGHGWRTTVPIALIVAVGSVFAGRTTVPSPDATELATMKAEIRADIAELKRDQQGTAKYQSDRIDGISNRLLIIEAKLGARP